MGGKGAKNRRGMIVCGGKRETPKKARIPFCAFIAGSHRAADLREERNGVMIAGRFSARRLQEDRGGAAEFFHIRGRRRIDTGARIAEPPNRHRNARANGLSLRNPREQSHRKKKRDCRSYESRERRRNTGNKKRRTLGRSVLPPSGRSR